MEGKLAKAKSGRKLNAYLFSDMLLLTEPSRAHVLCEYIVYREVPLSMDWPSLMLLALGAR